ncbi:hypothetical protein TcCL_NonESM01504, partial [Trypanosoma cruzi]
LFLHPNLIPASSYKGMAMDSFYRATKRSLIRNRMADLVRQQGDIQAQLAYTDEKGQSESMMTVSATISGLRWISGNTAEHWEDSTFTGHIADLRAPQAPNFASQLLLPIMRAARESGARQGLTIAEGRRSKSDNAVADVRDRNARLQH